MKPGHAYAWERPGATPALQAYGGTQVEGRGVSVAAGGMPYENEENKAGIIGRYTCAALKKSGEQCNSWCVGESIYCQGHLSQLQKLEKKIASCEDEAERLLLEEERLRKWR